ncbi:MAG: pyridine nucleotide-disulfide oxidoreductase, partial [Lachnospiraceae bacterium]|nr:pyridine nucleotide-disulfide oxidoreductase [Lachnospiraceae bacterium]
AGMDDKLTVRFRVDNNYRDRYVSVYFGDERVMHIKKRVLAPGEMEQVVLTKEKLLSYADMKEITIKLEDQ